MASSASAPSSEQALSLYFGYGSNLWLDQMKRRCPESKFVGVACLQDWRWMITIRGYANIVPSKDDVVYGLVYELNAIDEKSLDGYEGVPVDYIKKILPVQYLGSLDIGKVREGKKIIDALIYVDEERLDDSSPREEYVYRMNMGIADALQEGVPKEYIDKYLRRFIPTINEGK